MKAGESLRSVLAVRRHEINRRFAEVRAAHPGLAGDEVLAYLADSVSPVADAVHVVAPDAVVAAVDALCEVGLPLVAQGWLGPRARHPALAAGFTRLSAALPRALAENPPRFAGSVVNALYHLAQTPGARLDDWVARVGRVAARADLATTLTVGQVAAWRCGMAHLRDGALDLLPELPTELAGELLGVPRGLTADDLARLRADPWLLPVRLDVAPADPTASPAADVRLRPVGRLGGFAGFGGHFRTPPQVRNVGGQLHAYAGGQQFRLHADVFGAVLRPAAELQAQIMSGSKTRSETHSKIDAKATASAGSARLDPHGQVRFLDGLAELPAALRGASCADDGVTLAVTAASSHWIWLFAKAAA